MFISLLWHRSVQLSVVTLHLQIGLLCAKIVVCSGEVVPIIEPMVAV